ncbi:thiolase family protein [Saccharomonospora sp. NPDC046836]|uniref:thiolase family protein n=1 Tax=Saccharomonospora sp. NPDC046836 TaxID=3156921 RepID=UPI0033C3A2DA
MRGKTVIAGVGHTTFDKQPGRSTISMNIEACRSALDDASIEKDMVDALYVKYPTSRPESFYGQKLAEAMGVVPKVGGAWDQGGAANASMIGMAAMAIESGLCEVALVSFADNPRSGTRQAYESAGANGIYGWFGVPAQYAMVAQRHMAEYGTTSEQLGAIAVAARKHGAANPRAQLRKPLTIADHQESRWIVEPLHRADCCLVSDGGAAVVVTSEKRARQLGIDHAVPILGFGQGQSSWDIEHRPVLTRTAAKASAETAFRMAGLSPKDIDVAQLYDCFTITVLMMLEDYGFCGPGEGGKFVEGGALEVGGVLPANTSGGLLSETGMPGMQLVIEAVRQVRGESTSQVAGASTAIVGNQGGTMHTHSTLILGR